MSEIQNYKCPACGGMLQFSSREQKLVCANCKSSYDVAEFEAAGGLGSAGNYQAQNDQWNVQADGLVTYACKTCGGEVVGDQSMASTKCPYCDSPIVIAGQFSGAQRPDAIIPFKLNKHAAKEKLKQHMTSAKMVPSVFSSENHLQELKGVYVPFWLYDADVHAQATFEATKEKKWGYNTNRSTKVAIVMNYAAVVRTHSYLEREPEALNELAYFMKNDKDGTYGAIPGKHDDRVMARGIGLIVEKEMPVPVVVQIKTKEQKEAEARKKRKPMTTVLGGL